MRIITWNCQGAFRTKAQHILQYQPDILVVQECEHQERLKFEAQIPQPNDFLWFGENRHKGIGVFSFGPQKLGLLPVHNPAL